MSITLNSQITMTATYDCDDDMGPLTLNAGYTPDSYVHTFVDWHTLAGYATPSADDIRKFRDMLANAAERKWGNVGMIAWELGVMLDVC